DRGDSQWEEVSRLFRAVEEGNTEWGVPAYGGGLFARDPGGSRGGALLTEGPRPNTGVGPGLWDPPVIKSPGGWGAVGFGGFGGRESGMIHRESEHLMTS